MPAFDNLTKVTVTGHALTLDGNNAAGTVTFTPTTDLLLDTTTGEAIFPVALSTTFDGTGHISIALPVTNHPTVAPSGWVYNVVVAVNGSHTDSFQLAVPFGSASFDLFLAGPVPGSGVVYVPSGTVTAGDPWAYLLMMENIG